MPRMNVEFMQDTTDNRVLSIESVRATEDPVALTNH